LLDLEVEGVDHLVALGQDPGRFPIPGQQGMGGPGHPFAHQGEQLDDLPVDPIETFGDIVGTIVQCKAPGHRATVPPATPRPWGFPTTEGEKSERRLVPGTVGAVTNARDRQTETGTPGGNR